MVELPVTLRRLDHLAEHLSRDAGVQAVLGLGSAGVETGRFDEHSDIDFFVVVDDAETKSRYLAQPAWLGGFGGQVAYSFVNDRDGRKALFDDGLFVEYAIFTPPELASLPFAGARVVWSRPAFVLPPTNRPPAACIDTCAARTSPRCASSRSTRSTASWPWSDSRPPLCWTNPTRSRRPGGSRAHNRLPHCLSRTWSPATPTTSTPLAGPSPG